MFPPGMEPPETKEKEETEPAAKPTKADDESTTVEPSPQEPAKEEPTAEKTDEKQISMTVPVEEEKRSAADEKATAQADSMLPPTAASETPTPSSSKVDSMLPPSADAPLDSSPKSSTPMTIGSNRPIPAPAEDDEIVIPTEDGGYAKLHEPVKTVAIGDAEMELRRLSPEEKAKRRNRKSLIMLTVGMIFLLVMGYIFMNFL